MIAKPNRRWYQFSLKAVFVGMTLLSLGLGVWLKCIEPAERQRAMARRVERLGGYVRYADAPSAQRWPLPILRQWLPRDYFDALSEINLDAAKANAAKATIIKATIVKATDGDLADLHRFQHLQELWLNGTDVTDVTVKQLDRLRELRVVNLRGTKVTDEGLAVFANHSQLQILNLRETKLTGSGLTHLKDLSHLQILNLRDTDVDDDATRSLASLEELQSLFLDGTRVTDQRKTELRAALPKCDITPENLASVAEQRQASRQLAAESVITRLGGRIIHDRAVPTGAITMPLLDGAKLPQVVFVDFSKTTSDLHPELGLRMLREFPQLDRLNLSGTKVRNAQLRELAGCARLSQLNLANTAISDEGLSQIALMTELDSLVLHNTLITDAGLVNLKGLKKLSILSLGKTQVTDVGLVPLSEMSQLRFLQLQETHVTDARVEMLQSKLPKLTIVRQ
jgi:internalin A